MKCKQCGTWNEHRLHLPAYPDYSVAQQADHPPFVVHVDEFWACVKCNRAHRPDGTLYNAQTERTI